MENSRITYTNSKGQIVIPKSFRDALGVSDSVPVEVLLRADGIWMTPVKKVLYGSSDVSSSFEILKKTKGAWGKEKSTDKKKKKKKLELELDTSRRRRKPW